MMMRWPLLYVILSTVEYVTRMRMLNAWLCNYIIIIMIISLLPLWWWFSMRAHMWTIFACIFNVYHANTAYIMPFAMPDFNTRLWLSSASIIIMAVVGNDNIIAIITLFKHVNLHIIMMCPSVLLFLPSSVHSFSWWQHQQHNYIYTYMCVYENDKKWL